MGNSRSSDNLVAQDLPTRVVFVNFERYITQEAERYNSKHHRYIFSIKYRRYYWQISRRFSDIVTLDNRLNRPYRHQQLMVHILRPPKFNKFFWNHDETLLMRRGRSMAIYLQNVVDVPELFEEKIVRIFLELGKTSLYPELGRKGKAGYLKKCSGGYIQNYSGRAGDYIKTWRKRWVVLHDVFIAYYKSESDTIPLGYLQVDSQLACYSMARVITIVTKSRQLLLFAPTLREATEWVAAITSFYKLSPRASTQRFSSSFPVRPATNTHIYTCGKDYFAAAAIALLNAKEEILIASWMVSANLLMTRPPAPPIRLDQILKFKAEQGVKICVLLYKEIELSGLGNDSMKCKQLLESFGPNVKVMRHPNKLLGGSTAILWSHHEKLLIVDRNLAFVGGIDLCFGRYDDPEHVLSDEEELRFPGLDYYQPASALFRSVRPSSPRPNVESKTSSGSFAAVPTAPSLPIEYMPESPSVIGDDRSDIRSEASDESPRAGPEPDDGIIDIDDDELVPVDDGLTEEEQAMIREQQASAQATTVQPELPSQSVTQILYSDNIPVATTVEAQTAVPLPPPIPETTKTISPATQDRQRTSTLKDSWKTMLESITNLSDTVKANFDTMRSEMAMEKVRAEEIRDGIPRMPWHDIQACVTGVAARDIAAHFVLRWNHHRMAKGMLDIDPLVDVTDDPYFTVCAKCNTSKIFECITVCPRCGYNLGPASSLFIPWSESLQGAGHVIPIETLTFLQYECTFQSRLGCRIQGDGPVVVTMILDPSQCVGEGVVIDSQGEAEYLEKLLCMGIKPCIGDIILSVDGIEVSHLSTDQLQRYFIRRARKLENVPFNVRFRRHFVENIEEIVAHDKRIEEENFNRNVALFDNVSPDVQVSIVGSVSTVSVASTGGSTASVREVTLTTTASAPKSFAERIRSTLKQAPEPIDPAIERLNLVCAASVSREVGISMHQLLEKALELAEIPDRRTNSGTCHVQVLRSVGQWSVGHSVESSIRTCWIDTINNAQHFVYIENQFFVGNLAGSEVANGVAAALLQRLIRAATCGESFRAIVIIPLHPEGDFVNSSGPRLVMHYEYMTICRGASCFLEQFKRAVPSANPQDYISFCSLRNWGEIAGKIVFEQIYVHDKVIDARQYFINYLQLLIVDDRVIVMGSANINDRSMMGDRDTEVAIRIEDTSHMSSRMGGQHWGVGCLPHLLRVRLMATHLGDAYADLTDPISDAVYNQLWLTTARNNTEIYSAFEGDAAMDKCNTLVKYQRANAMRPFINANDIEVRKYANMIKGHVVMWPMEFLKDTDLSPNVATKVVVPNELWV